MGEPLIEVDDLHVRFRSLRRSIRSRRAGDRGPSIAAVCGVSLKLEPCQTLAVVGESGSGKTTLARALMGLVEIDSGRIRFGGEEITATSDRAWRPYRRQMAMMFQDPIGSLSPRMTVGKLIREPLVLAKRSDWRSAIPMLLRQVGLDPRVAERYPHQLSGGQARRVGIARALALRPRLLLADEPTTGLDVSVQGEILNLLASLRVEHEMAILVITHNLAIVRHIADRMAVMYLGRWVEEGPTPSVLAHPRHPYTRALLGASRSLTPANDSESTRFELSGETPNLLRRPSGCEFHPRCPIARRRCTSQEPASTTEDSRVVRCHYPLD